MLIAIPGVLTQDQVSRFLQLLNQAEWVDGKVTAEPLPRPLLRIFAQVDNRTAEVLYAGGAPGLVAGVLQMNIRIPEAARSGPEIPLTIGGMDGPFGVEPSERVTIAIR